jgi:hypothetical protein
MAMRYELPDTGWDLIIPEQKISQPSKLSMYCSAAILIAELFLKNPTRAANILLFKAPLNATASF